MLQHLQYKHRWTSGSGCSTPTYWNRESTLVKPMFAHCQYSKRPLGGLKARSVQGKPQGLQKASRQIHNSQERNRTKRMTESFAPKRKQLVPCLISWLKSSLLKTTCHVCWVFALVVWQDMKTKSLWQSGSQVVLRSQDTRRGSKISSPVVKRIRDFQWSECRA